MTKNEFLDKLGDLIKEYPSEETQKSIEYYSEMIDDRMEDGMTEEEAVASLGSVEDIVTQIKCELPLMTLVKKKAIETKKKSQTSVWVIVLLVLGAPLWIPLLLALGSVGFSAIVVLLCLAFAVWALDVGIGLAAVGCFVACILMLFRGSWMSSLIYFGGSLATGGMAVFGFALCILVTKGCVAGCKWISRQFKKNL